MDGRSFLPLLMGGTQEDREKVFTHFYMTSAKREYPMRSVITKKYGYIYNAWSDGVTVFINESQNGLTWNAMVAAAATDPDIAARVQHYQYRVKEELYDYETDPDALDNLADNPAYRDILLEFRTELLVHMTETNDPLRSTFIEQLMPFNRARNWELYSMARTKHLRK